MEPNNENNTLEVKSLETISQYLCYHSKQHPHREAIVFAHTDGLRTAVTFGQLYDKATKFAKSMIKLGVKQSEIIAIALKNCPEWLYATFGAILVGSRPISISFTYADGSDVIALMKKLETCSAIVLDPAEDVDAWTTFKKLVTVYDGNGNIKSDSIPYLKYLICRQNPADGTNVLTMDDMMTWNLQHILLPAVKPEDTAVLLQTSGSTGIPKAVAHTNHSITACVKCLKENFSEDLYSITYNDRSFNWIGGFPLTAITGDTRITRYGYSAEPEDLAVFLFRVIKREKCAFLVTLPSLLKSLMEKQDDIALDRPVKVIACGGQPLSKTFANCIGKLCSIFGNGYGGTEFLVGSAHIVDNPDSFKDNCIGIPHKGIQMKICDDDGKTLPANERGEIYVKCECMFKEYYNDPEKTKAVFTEDGWFKTDDIGFITEEGLFFCEGRKSEIIISGGMNVTPTILEDVIRKCPGVANVVCVPVAHNVMYQVVCACVIPENGGGVSENQIRQYCDEIYNDKPRHFTVVPTYYMFLKKFPETHNGKLSRKSLTQMAAEKYLSV